MKWILLAACGCSLFLTAGCVSSHEEWRGHAINVLYVDKNFGEAKGSDYVGEEIFENKKFSTYFTINYFCCTQI